MPRKPRIIQGGLVYHVLNRATGRSTLFHKEADYAAFEKILEEAQQRFGMRVLTYVVMPNHFHLVLWPRQRQGKQLSEFMRWLTVTHTQRYHAHYHTSGAGHVYQGRFKAFPVQADGWGEHLRQVCRYVERNPVRAALSTQAENWRWSGLWRRVHGDPAQRTLLSDWPEGTGMSLARWLAFVHQPAQAGDAASIRESMQRGRPLGEPEWIQKKARELDLTQSLRPRGRPRKRESQVS